MRDHKTAIERHISYLQKLRDKLFMESHSKRAESEGVQQEIEQLKIDIGDTTSSEPDYRW